ncbi:Programmed cell death protein 10 [Sparganum proliferum]
MVGGRFIRMLFESPLRRTRNVRSLLQSSNDAEQADRIRADVLSVQQAFDSVDRKLPGFTQDFLRGFMERFGFKTVLDVEEMTLRQIANAIKNLLDCINLILNALTPGVTKQGLDEHMRNFVEYSRKFSSALKKFFRDHGSTELFASAYMLVQQTNLILLFIRNKR